MVEVDLAAADALRAAWVFFRRADTTSVTSLSRPAARRLLLQPRAAPRRTSPTPGALEIRLSIDRLSARICVGQIPPLREDRTRATRCITSAIRRDRRRFAAVGCQAERCANPHDVRAPTPPDALESRRNSPAVTGPTVSSDRPRAQPVPARAGRRCRRSRSQMMPRGGRSPTGRRPDRGAHRPGDVRKYSGVVGRNPSRPGHGNSTARQAGCCDRA